MISKSLIFNIDFCIDTADNPGFCKTKEQIKTFLNEVTVQLWLIDSQIDMRFFHGESYARNQKLISENKIRVKDEIPSEIIFLGQRVYYSHESVFGDKEEPIDY